jgi:hypothetical protein
VTKQDLSFQAELRQTCMAKHSLSKKSHLGFFTGVGVGQVGIEILVQHLRGFLSEVPPLPSLVQESADGMEKFSEDIDSPLS